MGVRAKYNTTKDRYRLARINHSILNGLLNRNLTNEQVKKFNVPFLQIAGTNGQMLIEDLIEGFYVVFFSGSKVRVTYEASTYRKTEVLYKYY